MTIRLLVFSLLLVLAGCGGAVSQPNGTTPASSSGRPEFEERTVVGDACVANYAADSDVTIIAIEVPNVGVVAAAAIGDGWDIDCRPQGNQLLMASHRTAARYVSVVVDAGVSGMPELAGYAGEHAEASAASMTANGIEDVRVGHPTLVDGKTYVIPAEGSSHGTHFAQLSVYSLVPSPIGVLRYHISEIAPDGRALNASAELFIAAARAFNRMPEDAR